MRIVPPAGRLPEESKGAPRVITYTHTRSGKQYMVVGLDTPLEKHMIDVAWQFFVNAVDFKVETTSSEQFEVYARFFIDDKNVIRTLPGLYNFFKESSYMKNNRGIFWRSGHPDDDNVNLVNAMPNMKVLADNIKWFLNTPTRFWNTLEFRIGEVNTPHAQPLFEEYKVWVTASLAPNQIHVAPATEFLAWAIRSSHPFFNQTDRYNPRMWEQYAELRQGSNANPPAEKRSVNNMNAPPNAMTVDAGSREMPESNPEASPDKRRKEALEKSPAMVPQNPVQEVLRPVIGNNGMPSRYLHVPRHGSGKGTLPTRASVLGTQLRIKIPASQQEHVIDAAGAVDANFHRNLLSVIYHTNDDDDVLIVIVLLVPVPNSRKHRLIVRSYEAKSGGPLINAALEITSDPQCDVYTQDPHNCCVSWDGLRIVCNADSDPARVYQNMKLVIVDLVLGDDKLRDIRPAQFDFTEVRRVWSCTNDVLALAASFAYLKHGDQNVASVDLKLEPSTAAFLTGKRLLSVTNNAWIQDEGKLREAYKKASFVHLYASNADPKLYTIVVTPLDDTHTKVLSDGTFSYTFALTDAEVKNRNDARHPWVLLYPIPSYGTNANSGSRLQYDDTKDEAVAVWYLREKYAVVASIPNAASRANLNLYSPMSRKHAEFEPRPILNDLSLSVYNPNLEPIAMSSFK